MNEELKEAIAKEAAADLERVERIEEWSAVIEEISEFLEKARNKFSLLRVGYIVKTDRYAEYELFAPGEGTPCGCIQIKGGALRLAGYGAFAPDIEGTSPKLVLTANVGDLWRWVKNYLIRAKTEKKQREILKFLAEIGDSDA